MDEELLSRLVVVDTETTGADVFRNSLISYAFVPLLGDAYLEGYVEDVTGEPWSPVAKSYFSASFDKWIIERESPRAAVKKIESFIDSQFGGREVVMIGHNVAFDRYFLEGLANHAGCGRIKGISHRTIDTHSIIAALHLAGKIPESAMNSSGAFDYFDVSPNPGLRHTALGDALATRDLFKKLLENLRT